MVSLFKRMDGPIPSTFRRRNRGLDDPPGRALFANRAANEMLSLDERGEKNIDQILESLKGATDSLESQTRVARTKEDATDALKKCMEHYEGRRKGLKMETMKRAPRITREELFDDIGRFDAHIEKRLDQIIDVTKSLQLHKDYDKWSTAYGDGSWDEESYYRTRNPRYYQNRKETTRTEQTREKLVEELKDDLERLEQRNREIKGKLDLNITPEYRQMLLTELDANMKLVERRHAQMSDVTFPSAPYSKPIGRDHALIVEDLVGDMAKDIERDCDAVWRLYLEINQQRQSLKTLREHLEAGRELLKKTG